MICLDVIISFWRERSVFCRNGRGSRELWIFSPCPAYMRQWFGSAFVLVMWNIGHFVSTSMCYSIVFYRCVSVIPARAPYNQIGNCQGKLAVKRGVNISLFFLYTETYRHLESWKIFYCENGCILFRLLFPPVSTHYKPSLGQIMAWHHTGTTPLSEPVTFCSRMYELLDLNKLISYVSLLLSDFGALFIL